MAAQKKIVLSINADNTLKAEAFGFVGRGCKTSIDFILSLIGGKKIHARDKRTEMLEDKQKVKLDR